VAAEAAAGGRPHLGSGAAKPTKGGVKADVGDNDEGGGGPARLFLATDLPEKDKKAKAWGLLRTSTRPTLNRRAESLRLC
jgi:hypothetical protein